MTKTKKSVAFLLKKGGSLGEKCEALSDYLKDKFDVFATDDMFTTDNDIRKLSHSDVIIISDIFINGGTIVCSFIKNTFPDSFIILINESAYVSNANGLISKYFESGVDAFFNNDCSLEELINAVEFVLGPRVFHRTMVDVNNNHKFPNDTNDNETNPINDSEFVEEIASQILRKIGAKANLKGYRYSVDAIVYLVQHNNNVSITKELYPSVAKICNNRLAENNKERVATATRVERSIRHLIENIWSSCPDLDALERLIIPDREKGKPTNSEFLMTLADSICNGWYSNFLSI